MAIVSKKGFNLVQIGALVIVVVFVGMFSLFAYNKYVGPMLAGETTTPEGTPVKAPYSGNINWRVSDTDYVAGGAFGIANAVVYYSDNSPTDVGQMSVVTITGTVIPLPPANKGWAYIAVHNGDAEYALAPWAESTFLNSNSRVKEITYRDISGDSNNEIVMKVWCGDIPVSQSTDPVIQIQFPWVDMDSSVTDDSPADQAGMGLVAATPFSISWVMSGLTAGDGVVFTRIYVTTNGTIAGDDIRLESFKFTGDGWEVKGTKTYWAKPVRETEGSTYIGYYLDLPNSSDPLQGILAYRPVDKTDRATMTLTGKLYLEAGNDVLVTLCYTTITGAGATTDTTDPVILQA